VITLRGTRKRASSGGMHFGAKALETHQHTLFRHLKNEFFSRNLGQNMSKNAYFLVKGCKIAAAPGGLAPEPPLASGDWGLRPQTPTLLLPFTDIDLSNYLSSVKLFYYFKK